MLITDVMNNMAIQHSGMPSHRWDKTYYLFLMYTHDIIVVKVEMDISIYVGFEKNFTYKTVSDSNYQPYYDGEWLFEKLVMS